MRVPECLDLAHPITILVLISVERRKRLGRSAREKPAPAP
jgi:hypothetical protein